MDNQGLLFIPDISGFTRFVNETELDHSRHIIQELLEILINANQIGLEISEIEGDAILFYRFGNIPGLAELYQQVEKMFCAFHRYLAAYEQHRFCQCTACVSAINLTLKVITHYGEFTGYNVKNFSKLIGKDIIVAHQLLKNDIEQHEYWLVTNSLLEGGLPQGLKQWMVWNSSAKQTENGEIPFQYTQLSPLKNELPPEPPLQLEPAEKIKMITVSKEYEIDINSLFYATAGLNFRARWKEGVKATTEISHFLPQVGARYRSVQDNGETIMYTSSFSYHPEKIVYSETDENKNNSTFFILEKINNSRTRLSIDFYIKKSPVKQILFKLLHRKKMQNMFGRSLLNLEGLIKEIKPPGQM
jgi:hypothetical protein